MFRVREVTESERTAWDLFVVGSPIGSFLQSWQWGVFQTAAGFPVRRLAVVDTADAPQGLALLIDRPLLFGQHYFYAPWGPVLRGQEERENGEILRTLTAYIRTHVTNPPVYLRLEPRLPEQNTTPSAFLGSGYTFLGRGVQPKDTLVLDLTKNEDDLLREMHPKTRYNIRLALRHGVCVEEVTNEEGLSVFLSLAREGERKGTFHYHPSAYYAAMVRTLRAMTGMLHLFVASHEGHPLAAGLFITFGGTTTYAHGASSGRKPHVMAPTLLHWEAIRHAKERGLTWYDFFGIAPAQSAHHPWGGITRFKKGFGGRTEHYLGIADVIFDPLQYRLYHLVRGVRGLLHH